MDAREASARHTDETAEANLLARLASSARSTNQGRHGTIAATV